METYIPYSAVFNSRNRLNGWAKLIHITPTSGYVHKLSDIRFNVQSPAPIERIENRECYRPFLAIRKWKIWLMGTHYNQFHLCSTIKINHLKPISYAIRHNNQENIQNRECVS